MATQIETERLILRNWTPDDRDAFFSIMSDPEVMKYFLNSYDRTQSDTVFDNVHSLINEQGWGIWAAERKSDGILLGWIGLHRGDNDFPFSPFIEIAWRLRKDCWGQGYATEGAKATLDFAFHTLALKEVVSFTSIHNQRSESVMRRLGMYNTNANFHHPKVEPGHWLSEHVLYKITREEWLAANNGKRSNTE